GPQRKWKLYVCSGLSQAALGKTYLECGDLSPLSEGRYLSRPPLREPQPSRRQVAAYQSADKSAHSKVRVELAKKAVFADNVFSFLVGCQILVCQESRHGILRKRAWLGRPY